MEGHAVLENLLPPKLAAGVAGFIDGVGDVLGTVDAAWDQVRGSDAAGDPTTPGHLERGPRPTADELRRAPLTVPGQVDHARAQRDAERTLAGIDFSKPEINLWVPATGSHSIPGSWQRAIEEGPAGHTTSVALVDYPASANFNDSVSTGQETLRLVLAGIAERGGQHRVTVAGHSQGAWVIGDTIDEPTIARSIDRAVLYGHPAPARVDWARSADPHVRQVDDPEDPFTFPLDGGRQALAAIDRIADTGGAGGAPDLGEVAGSIATIAQTALANPRLSAYLIGKHVVPDASEYDGARDPHHYADEYADGARYLAGVSDRA